MKRHRLARNRAPGIPAHEVGCSDSPGAGSRSRRTSEALPPTQGPMAFSVSLDPPDDPIAGWNPCTGRASQPPVRAEQAMFRFGEDLFFVGQASCAKSTE